jgi:hypothetical protein
MEDAMNDDLDNRWSDAARQAALAVRKARAFAANPRKDNPVPKRGGLVPKPMVHAGGSATFDERTGKRNNTEKHIWIPPPDDPAWNDPKFVESFKRGVAERKKKGLTTAKYPYGPEIFYSSTGLLRPPPVSERYKDDWLTISQRKAKEAEQARKKYPKPSSNGTRVIIGGKRYTRVGNKLTPDVAEKGKVSKVFYEK